MKYSMYNVVWYDGVDAYVTMFILKSNIGAAKLALKEFWEKNGYDTGQILKIDKLYDVTLEKILALKDGNNVQVNVFERFKEMYF